MKPFRFSTTADAVIAYLERDGFWRKPSEIERGADLAWYSPLVAVLLNLEERGVLESRWVGGPYPRARQYHLTTRERFFRHPANGDWPTKPLQRRMQSGGG